MVLNNGISQNLANDIIRIKNHMKEYAMLLSFNDIQQLNMQVQIMQPTLTNLHEAVMSTIEHLLIVAKTIVNDQSERLLVEIEMANNITNMQFQIDMLKEKVNHEKISSIS